MCVLATTSFIPPPVFHDMACLVPYWPRYQHGTEGRSSWRKWVILCDPRFVTRYTSGSFFPHYDNCLSRAGLFDDARPLLYVDNAVALHAYYETRSFEMLPLAQVDGQRSPVHSLHPTTRRKLVRKLGCLLHLRWDPPHPPPKASSASIRQDIKSMKC